MLKKSLAHSYPAGGICRRCRAASRPPSTRRTPMRRGSPPAPAARKSTKSSSPASAAVSRIPPPRNAMRSASSTRSLPKTSANFRTRTSPNPSIAFPASPSTVKSRAKVSNVAIRGLNTNFTRVLLNNAPVAIASAGQDNAAQNREVDLDMFPPELFSQLTVSQDAERRHDRRRRRRHHQHAHGAAVRSRRQRPHVFAAGHRQQQGRRHGRQGFAHRAATSSATRSACSPASPWCATRSPPRDSKPSAGPA